MSSYIIRGGNRLTGDVSVSGSKNAALGIISAAMLLDGPCKIENIPDIADLNVMIEICKALGAQVKHDPDGALFLDPSTITSWEATHDKVRHIRGSYYLLGALLGRFSKASIYMPGGCNFGARPIDQHMKGFEALGATVTIEYGKINVEAEHLHGEHIFLDVVSVGATINIMIAAAKAEGTTVIENAAREPHIVDVANFLNTMGANIRGAGTDVIRITGVSQLPAGATYSIIPDQIEAGTYIAAVAACGGEITVNNVIPKHLDCFATKFTEMGVEITDLGDAVFVKRVKSLSRANFKTLPYPGFPTDMQAPAVAVLSIADGTSIINETIFSSRFRYVDELRRMGARIQADGQIAIVEGVSCLTGAKIYACDLRAGAALVIAGLAAFGITEISGIAHIERGYESFVEKLRNLGADIRREEYPDIEDIEGINA